LESRPRKRRDATANEGLNQIRNIVWCYDHKVLVKDADQVSFNSKQGCD
jgi:hypothetical protein